MGKKHKIAVVGASGYSGEELLRLLLQHPDCQVSHITSRQYAGLPIGKVFPRFAESQLVFSEPVIDDIARQAELAILALPHGVAADFALPLLEAGLRVVDISADFRLKDASVYEQYYDRRHPAPELLVEAVYGLSEHYRDSIRTSRLVACPGCYPTSILLPLLPLLKRGVINPERIIANSLSGVTGAGRKEKLPFLFAECNESIRPYSVTGHRHLPEMEQELQGAVTASSAVNLSFIPHLIPVNRGIHSTVITEFAPGATVADLEKTLHDVYADEPFVRLLETPGLADTKHVTFTNINEIGYVNDEIGGRIILSSAIDNLTKGAAGQAVQNMNIMLGLEESAGLM
ncbi:MAG: N-acetyl-gamma-glutamyl-phosphate reductase [Verrucomicrobiota bacterium]